FGKLVDSKTNKGIEGVSVQLIGNKFDTVSKKMKEAILGTMITKANGDFSFDNLSLFGNFKLKSSAIGYKALLKDLSFGIKMPQGGAAGGGNMQQILGMADKDLGNIKMEADATDLGNVTVTSSAKPQFEMGIDRKIFNVDKNLVSTGQTATEIMKNIPSLNVDIDGNVTLRNAAPTIFIDGRPTTLTLDQIPADIIDKVELITNPSAKFDASGGNAGILNIVLKKNKKTGYNGGIRTGIDQRGKINLGVDLNLRQTKANIFLNGNYNQRKSISEGITDRNNLFVPPSFVHNTTNSTNDGSFNFLRGGVDFFLDNRNTLTVGANFVHGQFNNENRQRVDSFINGTYTSYSNIANESNAEFKNWGSQLSFKHNFAKNGENISADANFNSSKNKNLSNIALQTFDLANNPKGLPIIQQTDGNGNSTNYTFQTDYENPLTDDAKLELGARAAIRDFENLSDQYKYDYNSKGFVNVPSISNKYKFNDQVYAAYATYSFKVKKWSYQLGLRAESSNYTGTLLKKTGADSASVNVQYPLSLFPSAFVTYKVTDKTDLQLNYSRRVNRPNFFQLMPFPDYSDPQNINIGNASLRPEFTNSFEVSYNNAYKKNANFLATAYFKYSTDLITRTTDTGRNAITGNPAYFNSYINANSAITYGLELTNKVPVNKWWDLTLSVNLFNSEITATLPNQSIANSKVSWFTKMNSNFKLSKTISIQFSGDYQAKTILPPNSGGGGGRGGMGGGGMMFGGGPQATAQGYNLPRYGFDLAIRKDWTWKNGQSGSLNLSVNDIFKTQIFKSYSESQYFTQTNERTRDQQIFRLNFSYRFGKFDATLFKRKNTKSDQGGGTDMMQQ
ncbi:MAG: hypothetical protein RLZZ28_2315, partial [Bacteroidota bacterium]